MTPLNAFLKRIGLFLLLSVFCFGQALAADTVIVASCPSAVTFGAPGQGGRPIAVDVNGNICFIGGSGTSAQQVQGNVASGTTDAGNPVKVGGGCGDARALQWN